MESTCERIGDVVVGDAFDKVGWSRRISKPGEEARQNTSGARLSIG